MCLKSVRAPRNPPIVVTTRHRPADSAFVLEGQQDAGTVSGDLAVLDLHAYFDHFGNAQVTQGFGGGSTPDSALGDRAPVFSLKRAPHIAL